MSTLKSTFDAQKDWCDKIGSKNCRSSRNLSVDKCKICCFDYLKAQLGMESFGVDPGEEVANRPIVNLGGMPGGPGPMDELIAKLEAGEGKKVAPVNTHLLIDGTMWLVVDHDTIKANGRQHTMTIRAIPTAYPAHDFTTLDKSELGETVTPTRGFNWATSKMRKFLNVNLFSTLPAALRGAALTVNLTHITFEEACGKCGSFACTCTCHGRILKPVMYGTEDKVWIPCISQVIPSAQLSEYFHDENVLDTLTGESKLLELYDTTRFPTSNLSIKDKDGNNLTWWLRSMFYEPGVIAEDDDHMRGMLIESLDGGYNLIGCANPSNLGYLVPHITI